MGFGVWGLGFCLHLAEPRADCCAQQRSQRNRTVSAAKRYIFSQRDGGADAAHGELRSEEEVGGGGGVEGVQRDLQQGVTVCHRSKVLQFVTAGRACGSTSAAEPWPSTMMPRMDALVASM